MRSSDQRYHAVQRTKRDSRNWEQWSTKLVAALRDARLGGSFEPLEQAIRGGAAEFSHILLACGRTATDFRRNYRVGSPNWHTVWANEICPLDTLATERLDGFAIMRLSREQAKNVKLRWTKLRRQDLLIHDPQGTHWIKAMGCWIDGNRDEHLGTLLDLRDRGVSLVDENTAKGSETALERASKEFVRFVGQLSTTTPDWFDWTDERSAKEAGIAQTQVKLRLQRGAEWYGVSAAEHRLEIEKALVVCEAHAGGGDVRAAVYDPNTTQRHCSASRLAYRLKRLGGNAKPPRGRESRRDQE